MAAVKAPFNIAVEGQICVAKAASQGLKQKGARECESFFFITGWFRFSCLTVSSLSTIPTKSESG
jgi:hypothetical protein